MPKHFPPELLPPPPSAPPSKSVFPKHKKKAESSTMLDCETSLLPADRADFRSDNWHQGAVKASSKSSWTYEKDFGHLMWKQTSSNEIVGSSDLPGGGGSSKNFLPIDRSRKGTERYSRSVDPPPSTKEANSIRDRWPPKMENEAESVVFKSPRHDTNEEDDTAWKVDSFESRLSDIPAPRYRCSEVQEEKTNSFTSYSSFAPIIDEGKLEDTQSESVLKTARQNNTITKTSRHSRFFLPASEKKHAAPKQKYLIEEEQPIFSMTLARQQPEQVYGHVSGRSSPAAERIRQRMKQGKRSTQKQKEDVAAQANVQKNVAQKESFIKRPEASKTGNPTTSKHFTRFSTNAIEHQANRKKRATASSNTPTSTLNTNAVKSSAKARFRLVGVKKIETSIQATTIEDENTHSPVSPVIIMKKFEGSMLSQQISDIEGTVDVHLVSSDSLTSLGSNIGRIRSILFRNQSKPDNVHLVEAMESDFSVYTESSIDPVERASFRLLSAKIVPVQCMVRKYFAKRTALLRLWATITIQSFARGALARSHMKCMDQSANMIQARFRGNQVRDRIALEDHCAVHIQRHVRAFLATMMKYEMLGSATMIQCALRKYLAIKKAKDRFVSVVLIQSAARGFLTRAQLAVRSTAATTIQAAFRRFAGYFHYQIDRSDVITVQCTWRKKLAIRKTNLLRWNKAAALIQSGLKMMGVDCPRKLSPACHSMELAMPSQEMLVHIASLISSLRFPTD